jgi:hypothetical protein
MMAVMKSSNNQLIRTAIHSFSIGLLAATLVYGQNSSGGWKRVGDAPPADTTTASNSDTPVPADNNGGYPPIQQPNDQNQAQPVQPPPPGYGQGTYSGQAPAPNPSPNYNPNYNQSQPSYSQPNYSQPSYQPPAPQPVPAQLTIPAGTYITVRVNQLLSSDKNQVGDAFSATLESPIVVNGVVVAEPGQTVGGRVAEAKKAGRIEGLARLGIQLTNLTLVDGQQIPIDTHLVSRTGPSSVGQDAGTIMGTTALGAAAGAVADWGRGAAIGAGAGAAVGIIGVLVTRGHPSIITPEQVLTFRLNAPVTISTEHAPQAFRYIEPGEYDRPNSGPGYGGPGYGAQYYATAPPPPYYGYPYYYAGYPYYWWPGFGFYWGPSFYFGRGFYGRGFYGRGFYGGRYYAGGVGRVGGVGHVGGGAVGHAAGGGGHR